MSNHNFNQKENAMKAKKKVSPDSKGNKPNDMANKGRGAHAKTGKGKKSVNK